MTDHEANWSMLRCARSNTWKWTCVGAVRPHRPHFHAAYQDAKAVFALDSIECIGGELPRTQQRLVEAWAEIHRAELLQAWARLQSGRPPLKIEPLH